MNCVTKDPPTVNYSVVVNESLEDQEHNVSEVTLKDSKREKGLQNYPLTLGLDCIDGYGTSDLIRYPDLINTNDLVNDISQMNKDLDYLLFKMEDLTSRVCIAEKLHPTNVPLQLLESTCISNERNISTLGKGRFSLRFSLAIRMPHFNFKDIMKSSGIRGWEFIGEQKDNLFHTYIWLFIHCFVLFSVYSYVKNEYDNWQRLPVIRTLSNNLTFVNEIPFPAITVCLPHVISNTYDYVGHFEKCVLCNNTKNDSSSCAFSEDCSFEEKASLAVASLICPYKSVHLNSTDPWSVFDENFQFYIGGKEFTTYAQQTFPTCDITMVKVMYASGEEVYREEGCYGKGYPHFVTDLGLCFTINGLKSEELYKASTILSSFTKQEIHTVDMHSGTNLTLENMIYFKGNMSSIPAYLNKNQDMVLLIGDRDEQMTTGSCRVLKGDNAYFTVHNPFEVPFLSKESLSLRRNVATRIQFVPELVVTDKSLESQAPSVRGCIYSYERELSMFKHYSERNCKTECIANCSLHRCGCVPYHLPRPNNSVNVCFSECPGTSACDCGCLPDCYFLSYEFESISETAVTSDLGAASILHIEYKKRSFLATVRVSKLADLMAYCFGIVGALYGFSLMMIFETFHSVTFRLWDSVKPNLFK